MITLVLSGVNLVLPSGSTLKLNWNWNGSSGANTLTNGSVGMNYSAAIPAGDVDQLGIIISTSVVTAVVARIQWSADGVTFVEEKLEQANAVSGGVQQFPAVIKEWGPNTTSWPIWRPVTAVYFKLGLYSNGAPTTNDSVSAFIMLQRPGQLQVSGT
jgi:hypothetical protein